MWAATYDGGGTHRSHSILQHPVKLWTETVSRLWGLRRQHWQQTTLLHPPHNPHFPLQPSQHLLHQDKHTDYSHPRHLHARLQPHTSPHLQHLSRPQSNGQHEVAQHQSFRHNDSSQNWPHNHRFPHQHDNQRSQGRASLHGDGYPSLPTTDSKIQHHSVASKYKQKICSTVPNKAYDELQSHNCAKPVQSVRKDGLQSPKCANLVQNGSTSIQHDCKNWESLQKQKGTKRSSSGWIKEVLFVPSDLVKESDTKALCQMVNKHVESYIHKLKQSSPTATCKDTCKDYNLLKTSHIIHAGSLYHFRPPNLDARREVLKAIQDYHINAEARAQLQKRAREFEQEKKQKQRRKAASQKQAAMEKNSRQSSVVNTLLK